MLNLPFLFVHLTTPQSHHNSSFKHMLNAVSAFNKFILTVNNSEWHKSEFVDDAKETDEYSTNSLPAYVVREIF